MAIVKANYTPRSAAAKENIRYIAHRSGKDNSRITRTLFSEEGTAMERLEAYRMIDEAEKGSVFFRFKISPDPELEDAEKDLDLRDITQKTMQQLEERLKKPVSWVAAIHADHAPHRHIHVLAVVRGKLFSQDFQAMRQAATTAALAQRIELDNAREQKKREQERKEAEWELQR